MINQPAPVRSMTGELFQPVRLYYKIHNVDMVVRMFGKLSCMNFDKANNRWAWLYGGETKSLKFKTPYLAIPKALRPIVLGYFYLNDNNEMLLDVGSIERATAAVVFFDKHLSKTAAEVAYCAIYNKLLPQTEHPGTNFDKLFAGVKTEDIEAKQDAEIERMTAMLKSGRIMEVLQERHFDLVEAFPTNFYPDGIYQLELTLKMRQTVALKRLQGHKDYTLSELISDLTHGTKIADTNP